VALNLNRREALGALGAIGATATSINQADARVEVGRYVKREGVHGRMTGAQAAAAALRCVGAPCVYGIPGAQSNEFWDAMKAQRLPYLLVTNESSASVMADACARATGRPGVFNVVPGPGLTNAMTGIGEALLDSVPIIALVTDVIQGTSAPLGQVHSLANAALLRPVVKELIEIRHQAEIPGAIYHAHQVAVSGEPGPVGITIPFPYFNEVWNYNQPPPPPRPVPFDEEAFQRAVSVLRNKRLRIGIYAGQGCIDAGPSLIAAAEMLQAPVATSVSGKGCIPDSHPLAVGWGYGKQGTRTAEKVFRDVDLVLAVGVRFSEVSTANYAIPKTHVIHVDANPNNLGRNVETCVSVCADAPLFLHRLLGQSALLQRPNSPPLAKKIQNIRQVDHRENSVPKITRAVDPMYFLSHLRHALGPDELIFVDVTASTHWASETMRVEGPRRYFSPTNNQSMGWAIPAAIGAQYVRPDRQVVSVTGDGCFLMSAMELSTAARTGLPVKFFVLDDGTYHYMQMLQEPVYQRTTATQIARINYAALSHGMGLQYNEICVNPDVAPGIARALGLAGPVLTRVNISYEGREVRWLNALKSTYVSRLPTSAKLRMASRIGVRSIDRESDSD